MPESLEQFSKDRKIGQLKTVLGRYGSILVAFSGGIDSSFLLKASLDFLDRENVLAVTAVGKIQLEMDLKDAREFAETVDAPWRTLERNLLDEKEFRLNSPDRCYHCKKDLFQSLNQIADNENLNEVASGGIVDDRDETRPGRRAGKELGVKKPLEEVGLTKEEVRGYAKELGLPDWNKPSNTCLATRVPFGEKITEEKLKLIRAAESFLADFGFEGFRVRHHGEIARLEFRQEDIQMAVEKRDEIVIGLKKIGYKHVTLDLAGY
jgi:uncharacterized protein